ncbi:biotin--[acetyl-CoA-carboxylase] ligase [Bacteroidota bacterium]
MNNKILKDIIILESIDSTNNYAIEILKRKKLNEGTVIISHEQTKGKGQMGNYWESEPGKNLTFSMILYPDFLLAEKQFLITKVVSLALTDFLENHLTDITIKWPNDIYYKDFKIAGILIENAILNIKLKYSVVGIGININQMSFLSDLPNAISLSKITQKEYDLHELLIELKKHLNNRYTQMKESKKGKINNDYTSKLYRFETLSEFYSKGVTFKGIIRGTDETGKLRVELENGEIKSFDFKEIEFINDNIAG